MTFIYFNPILESRFGYSPVDIIKHNFYLTCFMVVADIFWANMSRHFHPIRILKFRWGCAFILMVSIPFLIDSLTNIQVLILIQVSLLFFNLSGLPAEAVLIYHLPIYRRFTFASFIYALSRASMYIITSFGLVFLGNYFGIFGIYFITIPITLVFLYGVRHFESLERKIGVYPNLSFPSK
jgi:MHS family proline/betaine transporter-like MFS transporter